MPFRPRWKVPGPSAEGGGPGGGRGQTVAMGPRPATLSRRHAGRAVRRPRKEDASDSGNMGHGPGAPDLGGAFRRKRRGWMALWIRRTVMQNGKQVCRPLWSTILLGLGRTGFLAEQATGRACIWIWAADKLAQSPHSRNWLRGAERPPGLGNLQRMVPPRAFDGGDLLAAASWPRSGKRGGRAGRRRRDARGRSRRGPAPHNRNW